MDILTHAVASLALQRAFWPKAKGLMVSVVLFAGVLPDVDCFSFLFGPAAYLDWRRAATHSLIGWPALSILAVFLPVLCVISFLGKDRGPALIRLGKGSRQRVGQDARPDTRQDTRALFPTLFLVSVCSMLLHLAMDFSQADGVELLWPFSSRRFALDLLPSFDFWLLIVLVAAILLPELFLLVSEEIGSRAKRPRGQNGAIIGLLLATLYLCARFLLHSNAVAALDAHTIAEEMPRRVGAFPDSTSPFRWHCVVETRSSLNLFDLRSAGGVVTDASSITTLHKPDPSPVLVAAQNSPEALAFVKLARFPKATVESETEGYSVEIYDLKDRATGETSHVIFTDVNLDKDAHVVSSELQWEQNSRKP